MRDSMRFVFAPCYNG